MAAVREETTPEQRRVLRASGRFAAARIDDLAGKTPWHLRRYPATGILEGEAPRPKTLWVEFCWYWENGPIDLLDSAFDQTLDSFIAGPIAKLSAAEAAVLSSVLNEDEEDVGEQPVRDDQVIACAIRSELRHRAHGRDMSWARPY